ncbi:hypothetical protein L2E82_03617 [Cichorium intybus]|uniref:Uncharacterized protein n=1 Tax=Cichorium intybus TaxID=13427 RepID=A0ACB9H4S9_CICIN|nr:hypothetical protein L2E82_03617 [Cichorium intybus]
MSMKINFSYNLVNSLCFQLSDLVIVFDGRLDMCAIIDICEGKGVYLGLEPANCTNLQSLMKVLYLLRPLQKLASIPLGAEFVPYLEVNGEGRSESESILEYFTLFG